MRKIFTTMFLIVTTVTGEKSVSAPNKLGVGDVLAIRALHAAEFGDRNIKIDENGSIHLAMIGRVQAVGKTTRELAQEIEHRLTAYTRQIVSLRDEL